MTDSPPSPDDRTADLERRLADLERRSPAAMMESGRSGLEQAFWAVVHNAFPGEARKHLKAATREQLLAARVYLDRWIENLDDANASGDDPASTAAAREKIEVE
jgi:hypothetical protein